MQRSGINRGELMPVGGPRRKCISWQSRPHTAAIPADELLVGVFPVVVVVVVMESIELLGIPDEAMF